MRRQLRDNRAAFGSPIAYCKGGKTMFHDYYYYNKEQLLADPKIPLIVMEDNATVFEAMAQEMAEEIKRKNALGEKTVFICPVGPVGQYPKTSA